MQATEQLAAMAMFAKIVDTQSYTQAAALLGLSKSALSKEMVRLEVALGITLLRRTTRRIEVTEVGRAYYQYCARLLNEMKSADAFLKQFHEEPIGNLRLTAPVTFGNHSVLPALCSFIKDYVHVQVDLELTDRLVDTGSEEVDVAIVIRRDKPDNSSALALTSVEWGLYAAPDYLARHPAIRKPDDLLRHGFLSFGGHTHLPALSLRKGKKTLELKVRYLLRSNNSTSLMQAAKQGVGIAYLPQYAAREAVNEGALQQLLPEWGSETRTAYATFQETRFLSPRVRLFVEHLVRHFAESESELNAQQSRIK